MVSQQDGWGTKSAWRLLFVFLHTIVNSSASSEIIQPWGLFRLPHALRSYKERCRTWPFIHLLPPGYILEAVNTFSTILSLQHLLPTRMSPNVNVIVIVAALLSLWSSSAAPQPGTETTKKNSGPIVFPSGFLSYNPNEKVLPNLLDLIVGFTADSAPFTTFRIYDDTSTVLKGSCNLPNITSETQASELTTIGVPQDCTPSTYQYILRSFTNSLHFVLGISHRYVLAADLAKDAFRNKPSLLLHVSIAVIHHPSCWFWSLGSIQNGSDVLVKSAIATVTGEPGAASTSFHLRGNGIKASFEPAPAGWVGDAVDTSVAVLEIWRLAPREKAWIPILNLSSRSRIVHSSLAPISCDDRLRISVMTPRVDLWVDEVMRTPVTQSVTNWVTILGRSRLDCSIYNWLGGICTCGGASPIRHYLDRIGIKWKQTSNIEEQQIKQAEEFEAQKRQSWRRITLRVDDRKAAVHCVLRALCPYQCLTGSRPRATYVCRQSASRRMP